jgi:hypothetical protein
MCKFTYCQASTGATEAAVTTKNPWLTQTTTSTSSTLTNTRFDTNARGKQTSISGSSSTKGRRTQQSSIPLTQKDEGKKKMMTARNANNNNNKRRAQDEQNVPRTVCRQYASVLTEQANGTVPAGSTPSTSTKKTAGILYLYGIPCRPYL